MNKLLCEVCGELSAVSEVRPITYHYKEESITVNESGVHCDSCGESVLSAKDLELTRETLESFIKVKKELLS